MNWAALVPIALRLIGLSRYTALALKLLPYIATYGPIALSYIETAQTTWAAFAAQHPKFAAYIEGIAAKLLPRLPADQAAHITLLGIFAPHKMTLAEQTQWMNRASDAGSGGA